MMMLMLLLLKSFQWNLEQQRFVKGRKTKNGKAERLTTTNEEFHEKQNRRGI